MRLISTLTLAALLACPAGAAARGASAQSGRRPAQPVGPGQGGGGGERAGDKQDRSPADENGVYAGREVTRKAIIRTRPEPAYPREARRRRVQGTVRLRIILRADGRVDDRVEVQRSLPYGVTEAAISAARRIEFEPAMKGVRKVSQYVIVEYNFNVY
ncbi:MAG: energy transducer TonB [Acidobacteria bacterium]|nr:energy transducer TonB [Acidobacteriota bacterium]MCA1640666.1 energy transducer TonB [Acidobacteriota bacterium]